MLCLPSLCLSFLRPLPSQVSTSEAKLLLSALNIAASHAGSELPLFTQVNESQFQVYHGNATTSDARISCDGVCLPVAPRAYKHASGLVALFKSKLPLVRACKTAP